MYYKEEKLKAMLNNHINKLLKTLESDVIVNTEDKELIKKDILEDFMNYLYQRTHPHSNKEREKKKEIILKTNDYLVFKYRDYENKTTLYFNYHSATPNQIVNDNVIAKIYELVDEYSKNEYNYNGAFNVVLVDIENYLLWDNSPVKYKKIKRNSIVRLFHRMVDKILGRRKKEMILY
jgi:GR25 family glycosyltransferase involved in LPS biosynthesis